MVSLCLKNKGSAVRFCLWPPIMMKIKNQIKYWYRKYVPESIRMIIDKSILFLFKKFISIFSFRFIYFNSHMFSLTEKIPKKIYKNLRLSFSQQGEDLILSRLIHVVEEFRHLKLNGGNYVDAGCYHPIDSNTTLLLHLSNWKGVNIDISPESIELFEKYRKKDININAAIGHEDKDSILVDEQNRKIEQNNSLLATSTTGSEKYSIPQLSLKTIFSKYLNNEVDYLNIDIEGFEMNALNGIDFNKCQPKIISIEIHSQDIKTALDSEIANFLYSKNYKCIAASQITYFFINNQINLPIPKVLQNDN